MANWRIEDSSFYPLGLFNNSSENRTVFVTWTWNRLLTYIFKKEDGASVLKENYKIKINDNIKKVILTEFNTLLLLENQDVYYFSSYKSLKKLPFLTGVQCICASLKGYMVLKILDDKLKSIHLEVYEDFANTEMRAENLKSFNISFDEDNIFHSNWDFHTYAVLACTTIKEKTIKFFEQLLKTDINTEEIYLFSINGSLFGLVHDVTDLNNYSISLVTTVSSDIESIEFTTGSRILLLFLRCGAIEILYYSELKNSIDRTQYCSGNTIIAKTFSNESFYYSDGEKIKKIDFYYDKGIHQLNIAEQEQRIIGIIAFTWVKAINKLMCLSENNCFYRAKFKAKLNDCTISNQYFQLTEDKLRELEKHKLYLELLNKQPEKLKLAIKKETQKQKILKINLESEMYSNLIKATIQFTGNVPLFEKEIIYPEEDIIFSKYSYFIIITCNITWNDIFNDINWHLSIKFDQNGINKIRNINLTKDLLKNEINILTHSNYETILPKISMELNAELQNNDDFLLISIPIKIEKVDIKSLFTEENLFKLQRNRSFDLQDNILKLMNEIDPTFKYDLNNYDDLMYKFILPDKIKLDDIRECFNNKILIKDEYQKTALKIIAYFFADKITIDYYENENIVCMKSSSPITLFYAKILLLDKLKDAQYNMEKLHESKISLENCLKIQSNLRHLDTSEKDYSNKICNLYEQLRNISI